MPREPKTPVVWTQPNLFGTIASSPLLPTNVDFIPWDRKSNVINIKGGEAVWKGLHQPEMQYWAYCFCSPLASVIDRLSEADINGELVFIDKKEDDAGGTAVKRLKKLLNRPNPLQTWFEFRAQQVAYKKIFGYCLVYDMRPAGMETKYLWNICPRFATPIATDNYSIIRAEMGESPIKEWQLDIFGQSYKIDARKIFILYDGFVERNMDNLGLPISKIAGLDFAISNICAAMEADNVLLRKKGPLGFISHAPTSDPVSGYNPMTDDEKQEVQSDLNQYGLTWAQWQYVITRHGVKWNPISFDIASLQTKETIRAATDAICDRFGYPAELMSGKNATYENRTSAERFLYNTIIIPQNKRDMHLYTIHFDELADVQIKGWYDDYPVLMDNKVAQGESMKFQTEAYHQQWLDKLITMNQYRTLVGLNTVKGEDFYWNSEEYIAKYGEDTTNSKQISNEKTPSKDKPTKKED